MAWDYLKKQIQEGKAEMRWGETTIPGTSTLEATLPSMCMPLGVLTYSWELGSRISLCYIWVHEDLRRAGLATKMLNHLLASYSPGTIREIATGQVNDLSKPWCLKNGFVYNKARNYWSRDIPAPKKSRAKPVK